MIDSNEATNTVGGAIEIQGKSDLTLEYSAVRKNKAKTDGGGIAIMDGSTLILEDTVFLENEGRKGGAIFVTRIPWKGVQLNKNITVRGNLAHESGGGVFISDPNLLTPNAREEVCPGCSYFDNSAVYGPDFATVPFKLSMIKSLPQKIIALQPIDVEVCH